MGFGIGIWLHTIVAASSTVYVLVRLLLLCLRQGLKSSGQVTQKEILKYNGESQGPQTHVRKIGTQEKGQEPTSPPHSPTQMILLTCIRAEHASGPGIRGAGGGDQGLEEPQALRWPGGQGTERGNPEDPGCRGPAAVPFQKGELSEMVPSALYQPSECIHAHTHSKSHAQGLSGPRPLMAHTNVQLCQEDFWEM